MFVVPTEKAKVFERASHELRWRLSDARIRQRGVRFCADTLFDEASERFRADPANIHLKCGSSGSRIRSYYNFVLVIAGVHLVLGGAIVDVWADDVQTDIELPLTYHQMIPRKAANVHSTPKRPNTSRRRTSARRGGVVD